MKINHLVILVFFCAEELLFSQKAMINYDKGKIPQYALPDPLKMENEALVKDEQMWMKKRRPELLKIFEKEVYGKAPSKKPIAYKVTSIDTNALAGKAIRKEVAIWLKGNDKWQGMNMLIYLPKKGNKPYPTFLGLNFLGNHSVANDPWITIAQRWMRGNKIGGVISLKRLRCRTMAG